MSAYTAENWEERALCREADPALFFPEGLIGLAARVAYRQGKKWCANCPVRIDCREAAMAREGSKSAHDRYGLFGGLDPIDRAELQLRREHAQTGERAAA